MANSFSGRRAQAVIAIVAARPPRVTLLLNLEPSNQIQEYGLTYPPCRSGASSPTTRDALC